MEDLKAKLQQAVDEGIISAQQLQPLLSHLDVSDILPHAKGKFDLTHTVWFLGALLMLFACGIMAWWVNDHFGTGGLVLLSTLFMLGFFYTCRKMYAKNMLFLSALLVTILVIISPFWLTLSVNWFTSISDQTLQSLFAITLIVTATLAIHQYRFPLLIVAIYAGVIALMYLWLDIDLSSQLFWLVTGWITIGLAWLANLKTRMNFTFWLNKIAVAAIAYGITLFVDKQHNNIDMMFLWVCIGLLVVSVYLRYPSFVMTAALGVVTFFNHLIMDVYDEQYLWAAALIIALQAGLLIYAGIKVFNHKQQLNNLIDRYCPAWLVKIRPTPLPDPLSFGA